MNTTKTTKRARTCDRASDGLSGNRFRPRLEALEGRVLPSTIQISLSLPVFGPVAPAALRIDDGSSQGTSGLYAGKIDVVAVEVIFLPTQGPSGSSGASAIPGASANPGANAIPGSQAQPTAPSPVHAAVRDVNVNTNVATTAARDTVAAAVAMGSDPAITQPAATSVSPPPPSSPVFLSTSRPPLSLFLGVADQPGLQTVVLPPANNPGILEPILGAPLLPQPAQAISNRIEFQGGSGGARQDRQDGEAAPINSRPTPRPEAPPPADSQEEMEAVSAVWEPLPPLGADLTEYAGMDGQSGLLTAEVAADVAALAVSLAGLPVVGFPENERRRRRNLAGLSRRSA
jgi:hypothetical protein